ncbi:MAG: tRNA pseudouridine(38-40) synthase TruA [Dehalococcoidia bacterium]
MRRFAATVAYDGTDYFGSQLQPLKRSVQGELEKAAGDLFGVPTRVALAGRTDRGVHARGQIAAFSAETRLDAETVGRALNARLSEDVAVRSVRDVPAGFDPRRNAVRRRYRYTIRESGAGDPLTRRTCWQVPPPHDIEPMRQAAGGLVGTRDFAACAGALETGRTSVRSVFRAVWTAEGPCLLFDIEGNAFLPQMVRRLVGALERVGRGNQSVEEFLHMLEDGRPATLGPLAPPQGLSLERVWYDEGYAP